MTFSQRLWRIVTGAILCGLFISLVPATPLTRALVAGYFLLTVACCAAGDDT